MPSLGQRGGAGEAIIDHSSAPLRSYFRSTSAYTGQGHQCHQFAFACAFPSFLFCSCSSRLVQNCQCRSSSSRGPLTSISRPRRTHTRTLTLTHSIFSPFSRLRFPLGSRTRPGPRTSPELAPAQRRLTISVTLRRRAGLFAGSYCLRVRLSHPLPLTHFACIMQNTCLSYGLGLEYKHISARCTGALACTELVMPGGSGCTRSLRAKLR